MRFDPGKGFPHPVLRPPEYGDDYPKAEFQVEIVCERAQGGLGVLMAVEFELSDLDLLRLVSEGSAEYVLVVKSSKTHYREEFRSTESQIKRSFKGEISGRVEFSPFLVCVKQQHNFIAKGWHSDFEGLSFNIMPGFVLAGDKPKEYWIDMAKEEEIGSIFQLASGDLKGTQWKCNLGNNHVQIELSETNYNLLNLARDQVNNTPEAQYLMNGLYLPVLIHVLNEADKSPEEYAQYRWFTSLNNRLEVVHCKELGSESVNRALDAQMILEYPFIRMPMIAEAAS